VFLGLDLGTSGLKALLVDGEQRTIATTTIPLTVQRPNPGWSEQDPAAWWDACLAAIDTLHRDHPKELAATQAIGLAGQMHGAVLLAADGHPLRSAILWNDTRAQAECAALEAALPNLRQITGNIAMPGFTAPKLLWLRTHEPDLFARLHTVLLPKAYLRHRLAGELIEDMSDAAGTLWLDTGARDWSDAALAATGLARRHMPALVEGNAPAGTLKRDLAARWNMKTPSSPAAPETTPPAPSASAPSDSATPSSPSAPPASSSPPPQASAPGPKKPSTPSATPSPTSGTRWASPSPPPPRSPGGPPSPTTPKPS